MTKEIICINEKGEQTHALKCSPFDRFNRYNLKTLAYSYNEYLQMRADGEITSEQFQTFENTIAMTLGVSALNDIRDIAHAIRLENE